MIKFDNVVIKFPTMQNYLTKIQNFKFSRNEIVIICGENGSGKSTLLNLMTKNNTEIIFGKILWNEEEFSKNKPTIAYLPQFTKDFFYHSTLNDEVEYFAKFANVSIVEFKANLEDLLCENFSETNKIPLYEMDNGRLKIINLLFSLLLKKEIVLLDEPDAGFSYFEKEKIAKIIKRQATKSTIFVVSHDLYFSKLIGTKFLYLDKNTKQGILFETFSDLIDNNFNQKYSEIEKMIQKIEKIYKNSK